MRLKRRRAHNCRGAAVGRFIPIVHLILLRGFEIFRELCDGCPFWRTWFVELLNRKLIHMKSTLIQPYLFLGGDCAAALDFYRTAIGAKVEMLMKYSESPEKAPPGMLAPDWENKIMHCSFRVGDSVVMASDGCKSQDKATGFSLSLSLPTEADVKQTFTALSEGGTVTLAPTKTFWSPCFGMLTDRFGVGWMLSVTP